MINVLLVLILKLLLENIGAFRTPNDFFYFF